MWCVRSPRQLHDCHDEMLHKAIPVSTDGYQVPIISMTQAIEGWSRWCSGSTIAVAEVCEVWFGLTLSGIHEKIRSFFYTFFFYHL